MMVDARVEGVQLFNIRGKNAVLPEGIPVLDFSGEVPDLATSEAVVVKPFEDITLLKAIFQKQLSLLSISKMTLTRPTI